LKPSRLINIGDMVRLRSTRECGIVLLVWVNERGDRDCYVAFYGKSFPKRAMILRRRKRDPKRPYVLRYYDTSLEHAPCPWRLAARQFAKLPAN
jgi:hypothetical protein